MTTIRPYNPIIVSFCPCGFAGVIALAVFRFIGRKERRKPRTGSGILTRDQGAVSDPFTSKDGHRDFAEGNRP